ncbi:uncharacterized protein [Lolium perenne]|uniref:uncharacterized protein isoform X1 n=1 Tax=Lolium perenne TaxID=4522 RepID=UPI0021F6769E|nr:uncharacterized protein LOC127349118 isoform X2 [Lolium perenne]
MHGGLGGGGPGVYLLCASSASTLAFPAPPPPPCPPWLAGGEEQDRQVINPFFFRLAYRGMETSKWEQRSCPRAAAAFYRTVATTSASPSAPPILIRVAAIAAPFASWLSQPVRNFGHSRKSGCADPLVTRSHGEARPVWSMETHGFATDIYVKVTLKGRSISVGLPETGKEAAKLMKKQSTYRLLSGEEDDDIDNHTFYFTNYPKN